MQAETSRNCACVRSCVRVRASAAAVTVATRGVFFLGPSRLSSLSGTASGACARACARARVWRAVPRRARVHALCAQLAHTAWSARKGPPGPNFPALMNTKSPWSSPGKQVCHRRQPASTVQVSSRQADGFTLSSKVAAQRSGSAQLENDKAVPVDCDAEEKKQEPQNFKLPAPETTWC